MSGGEVLRHGYEALPKNPYTADSGRGIGRCFIAGGLVIMISRPMGAFAGRRHGTSLGNVNFFPSGRDRLVARAENKFLELVTNGRAGNSRLGKEIKTAKSFLMSVFGPHLY